MERELRPYQQSAYEEAMSFFFHGGKSAIIVLPTGLGKTIVMASIAEKVAKNGGKVLLLAHRNSLVTQGASAIEGFTEEEEVEIYKPKSKSEDLPLKGIVVATVQTMANRLSLFPRNFFSLIMVDETHHIPASTYQKIIEHFERAKLLGVTATPVRGDRTDVTKFFDKVVSEYTLSSAIQDGWLSPIHVKTCRVNIDVRNVEDAAGDFSVSGIGSALVPVLKEVALAIKENAGDRKTIVFVPLVSTAVGMVEIFSEIGVSADWVAGERKESEDILKAYHEGKFQVLINSMLLTEGYDEPGISCLVNLRVTKALSLYTQMIGRGTRKCEGKEDLLVLDFLWNDKKGRHHLNAKSVIAIASGEIEEELVPYFMDACTEEDPEESEVMERIAFAKKNAKEAREKKLAEALKEKKSKAMNAEIAANEIKSCQTLAERHMEHCRTMGTVEKYRETEEYTIWSVSVRHVSQFTNPTGSYSKYIYELKDKGLIGLGCKFYEADKGRIEQFGLFDEPTKAQLDAIARFGIPTDVVADKGHASFLLDVLYKRTAAGLCTYKMAKLFSRYGVKSSIKVSKEKAMDAVQILKKNNWRPNAAFRSIFMETTLPTEAEDSDLKNLEIG